ncbi:MAG: 4Fe-4S binding protein [Deltaproteobacteria bacterium]|nr:4Fe-4S binding protein [Deltaproteobacteria bacterium]MBN2674123.1 4Fe-4S binding protein [Deltaproteobacteria bacterium]
MTSCKKAYLHFPKEMTDKPFIGNLIKEFDLTINIFRAKVTPGEGGYLSIEIVGDDEQIQNGFTYLKQNQVEIHSGDVGLIWRKEECTHCTNCTVHCPTGALHIADWDTRRVEFDESKCIECLACLKNCPFHVCSSIF